MTDFANQTVVITGAGSGIGRQLACDLATAGGRVGALDRSPGGLADLSGPRVATAVADVTDRPGLTRAVAQLEQQLGPTDILIACAGIGLETSALDFHAEDIATQLQVNLVGVASSIEAVLAGMRQRGRGHLVAISSLASYRGLPRMAGYCASKAGLNAMMEALRLELKPLGIATTTVCPGWVRTPLTTSLNVPDELMMDVAQASRRILAAIGARQPFCAFPAREARRLRLLSWLPAGLSDWLAERGVRRMLQKWPQLSRQSPLSS